MSQSYTIVLDTEPAADVTVAIQVAVPDDADIAVDQDRLGSSRRTTWNTPQTVTVTATQDDDAVTLTIQVTITHAVSGGDYDAVTAADVEVTIIDDDTTGSLRVGNGVDHNRRRCPRATP